MKNLSVFLVFALLFFSCDVKPSGNKVVLPVQEQGHGGDTHGEATESGDETSNLESVEDGHEH